MENSNLVIIFNRLKSEILAEIKLLTEFSLYIGKIKIDIQQKNWVPLEKKLRELDELSHKVENLEHLRGTSFKAMCEHLGLPEKSTFQRAAQELGFRLRGEFLELHERLRTEVFRVKIEYQNLGYYLRNISGFIYQFLGEVFPHTKGKIYSRQGTATVKTPESVMINKRL